MASSSVTTLTGESKIFANKINWNPNNDLTFDSNAIVDISKSILNETNFGDYNNIASNILLSTNYFLDYDINMRKTYKYKLKINDKTTNNEGVLNPPYEKYIYIRSLSLQVSNCEANYNFSTNKININWDNKEIINLNKLNETLISYNIWIYSKTNNSNLVKFNSNTTSITISTGDSAIDTTNNSNTTFTIQKGEYYIYIIPNFVTTITSGDETNTYNKDSYESFFKSGKTSIPNIKLKILPEPPKNFKISSTYKNGKISFSWSKPISTPVITPSQYILTIENPLIPSNLPESINTINISGNKTSYTFDNTNLTLSSALRPGSYNVKLRAIYYSLESEETNTLFFTVPVTKVNFDYALVNSSGIRTKNIKNGVAGIILKWDTFSYAKFYKISIQQFDENGFNQNTETYHVGQQAIPNNELKLKWNFPTKKSRFLINMSYTTDTTFVPVVNDKALGESYLGVSGVNYIKEFALGITIDGEVFNIGDLERNINLDTPVYVLL